MFNRQIRLSESHQGSFQAARSFMEQQYPDILAALEKEVIEPMQRSIEQHQATINSLSQQLTTQTKQYSAALIARDQEIRELLMALTELKEAESDNS